MNIVAWAAFLVGAMLEVAGDAIVRRGLRGGGVLWVLAGCAALAGYGLMVNSVRWDFSRLMGVYIGFFALAGVLAGRFLFGESVPRSTWAGLGLIFAGGLLIQFGHR
jgi:small multidrug resistance family-3 protein